MLLLYTSLHSMSGIDNSSCWRPVWVLGMTFQGLSNAELLIVIAHPHPISFVMQTSLVWGTFGWAVRIKQGLSRSSYPRAGWGKAMCGGSEPCQSNLLKRARFCRYRSIGNCCGPTNVRTTPACHLQETKLWNIMSPATHCKHRVLCRW